MKMIEYNEVVISRHKGFTRLDFMKKQECIARYDVEDTIGDTNIRLQISGAMIDNGKRGNDTEVVIDVSKGNQ